jgi:pilus assembly protein CpaC
LQEQIKEVAPNDDIRAEMAGDTIVLSGHAKNEQTVDKVVRLAQSYAVASQIKTTSTYEGGVAKEISESSGKVINHIVIEEAQQVLLKVKVAQLDKTKMKQFGISTIIKGKSGEGFTNLVGAPSGEVVTQNFLGPGVTTRAEGIAGSVPGLSAIAPLDPFQIGISHFPSGLGAVLQALASKGYAKILAEPNLTVRSGERGMFHVGTRYPIQVISGTGANATVGIQYEDVGIRLNFAPTVLETGGIRLKIDPAEVSSITNFVQLQNLSAPIVDTRTVSTSVELREGESLVLAGLLSEDMKKNISKIPLFGDIPILGALFRSTTDELDKLELVFFITPELVKPMPPGTKTELPGQKPLTPEEEKEFQWIPFSSNSSAK